MINLLPPATRRELRAGRSNSLLLRYTILLAMALVFLAIAIGITYVYLSSLGAQADATRQDNEQRAAGYAQAQTDATQLRGELSTAKTILDKNISYSLMLTRFSSILPPGTAVGGITLSEASFSQPTSMQVLIRGEQEALALSTSLTSSPYLTGAVMGRVSTNPSNSSYPYSVEVTFTFNRSIGQ